MRIDDFDFELPPEQIAQQPISPRDASRLMVVSTATGARGHRRFFELDALLRPGDLLVLNDTRVIPARLVGKKAGTGGKAELLVVRPAGQRSTRQALSGELSSQEWVCLGQTSKGLKAGLVIELPDGLIAEVVEARGEGEVRVRFRATGFGTLAAALEKAGRLPLPPYIERPAGAEDAERYQTVYARAAGSVTAPTAGLHFTPELFARLQAKGVARAYVTLDVGPGTFLPVREAELDKHRMHPERFEIPQATRDAVAQTRAGGGRVVAVGTTVVRTLEAATDESGALKVGAGETSLFIRPGFVFRQVDVLVTNFHLPKSTLLVLVSAFLGKERALEAYREAVREGYRFFSYGDAMLIGEVPA